MTVATLGIEVRSEEAARASKDLDLLTGSAKKAEAAAVGLKAANTQAAVGMTAASAAAHQEARALQASAAAARLNAMAMQAAAAQTRALANNKRMLVFQLNDVAVSLASGMPLWMTLVQQGSQISQLQGGIAGALKETGNMAWRAATRFPLLTAAVVAAGVGFAGLTYEINKTTDVAVGIGHVFQATMLVARDAIYSLLKPAIDAIAPWFSAAWDIVVGGVKNTTNALIGGFVGAFNAIKATWSALPAAIGDIGFQAADRFYVAFTTMLRDLRAEVNAWIISINTSLGSSIPTISGGRIGLNDDGTQKHLSNPFKGSAEDAGKDAAEAFWRGFNQDYAGQAFDAVRDKAIELARAGEEAGKSLKDAAIDAIDPWENMRRVSARAKEEMDAIKQRAEDLKDAWQDFGRGATDLITGLVTGTMSWRDALSQAIPLILELLANLTKAGLLGGSGGWLASLLGAIGFTANANGNAYQGGNVIPFARGGVVSRPTLFPMAKGMGLMGEAGPEAIMPLRRGPDGRLGVAASGSAATGQPSSYNDNRTFNIDARGAQKGVGEEIKAALAEYDKGIPDKIDAYQRAPRRRVA